MAELMEERQAKVEATLEQMDKRLSNVEVAVRELNVRIDDLSTGLNARIDALSAKIDTNFRWIVGIMITMWVTTILAIIATIFTILLKG